MNSETPEKSVLKAVCRKRPDGEIIVLFPEEPGDPDGVMAVGFALAGEHFPCDPRVVYRTTSPASEEEANKVLARLREPPFEYEIKVYQRIGSSARVVRSERKGEYRRFERLRHLY